jgi:hypothetical protein
VRPSRPIVRVLARTPIRVTALRSRVVAAVVAALLVIVVSHDGPLLKNSFGGWKTRT